MPAFSNALTALAALSVSGVARNAAPDALPLTITRAHLPILLVIPGDTGERSLFNSRSEGFTAAAFPGGARTLAVQVTHLLLVASRDDGLGARSHLPRVIALLDAYFAALSLNPTLSGTLCEPARVTVEPGSVVYSGAAYHGATLRHLWVLGY